MCTALITQDTSLKYIFSTRVTVKGHDKMEAVNTYQLQKCTGKFDVPSIGWYYSLYHFIAAKSIAVKYIEPILLNKMRFLYRLFLSSACIT